MKRVAFVTTDLTRKGGGLYGASRRLAQSLLYTGKYEVTVFGSDFGEHPEDVAAWGPVELIRLNGRERNFAFLPGLIGALVSWKPDIIHAHGIWQYLSLATWLAKARIGAKLVISAHGMLDPWILSRSRLKKFLATLVYQGPQLRAADCLHALCPQEAASYRAFGLSNPICLIPNGVDPHPDTARNSPPPWHEDIALDKNVILYLGRLHPKKGLDNLLLAWREWKAGVGEAAPWFLAIAGWGDEEYTATIRRACADGPDIRFLGPLYGQAKAAALLRSAAFILPSFSEGLPLVVLEAWAAGVPVLMTEHCNLPVGFKSGAAIPIETDVESIRQGLSRLAAMSSEERGSIGACGLDLVRHQFTWESVASEMDMVYAWLLDNNSQPRSVSCD